MDALLSTLNRVRATGPRRWVACCPAHDDKHPSLSLRELDDGRILVHCFAGCDIQSVLAAVGFELGDLFPRNIVAIGRPDHKPWRDSDLIQLLDHELLIVFISAVDQIEGKTLTEADLQRLQQARARISAIGRSL